MLAYPVLGPATLALGTRLHCKSMSKKSPRAKSTRSAAPQAAQLDAVRKLSYSGRDEEARRRVAALRERYPDFKPLLGLAWEVDDNAGDFLSASLHAWDWSMASPGSMAALEALRDSAFDAGLAALGASAARRLAQAQGTPFPELSELADVLAGLTFDQAATLDLSRLFLTHGRIREAIAALEGIDHPSARNNLALARFAQGEIAAALAGFEANWPQDAHNLFALSHIVRLRLWTGGHAAAAAPADALRDAQPRRAEDAYGKLFSLLLLGAHDEVLDGWRAVQEAGFWDEANAVEHSACAYFAGLAAWHKGDREAAGALLDAALELDPDNPNADDMAMALTLHALGEEIDAKAGAFHDWFPRSWTDELRSAKGARAQDAALHAQQRRCDAHADYLGAAAELGGEAVRFYAMAILKLRATEGDGTALAMLRRLLTRPCGPDSVRLDLDAWLQESGLVEAGQLQQVLLHGEVCELSLRPMQLHAEPKDLGLPPAAQSRLEQMHALLGQNEPQRALRIAEELAAAHPGNPALIGNIAAIKDALSHALDEIEALFRRAAELDPAYLFAQAGLARVAARKGDPERARELLTPLEGREKYHFSEWRAILIAELEIARAQQDTGRMRDLMAALRALADEFG